MYARLIAPGHIVQLLTRADLDKQSLSYAAVFGLIEDLDLQGSEYSWCTSIFYFGRLILDIYIMHRVVMCIFSQRIGQLAAEFPFIYLMSRLPLTQFVGVTM